MSKLNLSNVTLVCIDGINKDVHTLTEWLQTEIDFYDCKLFTDNINSITDYNNFIVHDLHKHIESEFCMIVQADGHPVNIDAWSDEFLKYDYIGAPWYTQPWHISKTVGNGGFSIRSKRFLEHSADFTYYNGISEPEDVFLCRTVNEELRESGLRFAPHDVAYKFSVEDLPYKGQFGFHGKGTIGCARHFGLHLGEFFKYD